MADATGHTIARWPGSTAKDAGSLTAELRRRGPAVVGFTIPFALIAYLGFQGGGYDQLVRGQVGVIAWWATLALALVGTLSASRISRLGWVALVSLGFFVLWTAIGISWSESAERSVTELTRVLAYLGVFALALSVQSGRDAMRRTLAGVTTAVVVVGTAALLSRLHPAWFPANETADFLPGANNRLGYPVHYWNGLAALMAIGIPLLLAFASAARSLVARGLAIAAVPVLALAAFFTLSRGGAVEIAIGLVALLALHPSRRELLPTLVIAGVGSAILIGAALQRSALTDALGNSAALKQGDQMLAMLLVVCVGVALLHTATSLAVRHGLARPLPIPSRRIGVGLIIVAATATVGLAVAIGAPGYVGDRWEEFKQPVDASGSGTDAARFESFNGNGRYQWWSSAVDANASSSVLGIGPGNFEFWWAENGNRPGFVRDAHSLYLETLGETGIIGLLAILGLVGTVIAGGLRLSLRHGTGRPESAILAAGATAAAIAFATAAAIDWVWELAVLPVLFLVIGASLLGHPGSRQDGRPRVAKASPLLRGGAIGLSLVAAAVILIPMAAVSALRDGQADFREGAYNSALSRAQEAANLQPYAASPNLQQALVLERLGSNRAAVEAAREATQHEPTNWRTWFVLSRLEAVAGNSRAAVDAYRQAKSLNPRSQLFAQ